jgi:hypothetical protein
MAPGLLFVYTDVGDGPVAEAEYHDWYDHEHGPARLRVPGLVAAYRYQALDEAVPRWLALYELDSPAVLDSAEYKAVVEGGSDRDKFIMSHLGTLDRRIYTQLSDDGLGAGGPAPVILAVANSVPPQMEADMTAWYEQEHIPMLLDVPGWQRIRRFELTGPPPLGDGLGFLSLHELAGPAVLSEPGYRAAVSTPWRNRIVAGALSRERRVLSFRNSFC